MADMNESSAIAAATAAAPTTRVRVPGKIVAAPADLDAVPAAPQVAEDQDAGEAGLGELISRERRRHAETRAEAEPLTDARGARVCCVLCFNRNAELPVEDAG
ncbi:MAG TPA: hypothetical protein VFY65_14970 [Longimicrobium sp.]|nr:hypothetical protein [Longimicrobium sp.]